MEDVTIIGTDLARLAFQVRGQKPHGNVRLCKKFSRKQLTEFFATFHARTAVVEASACTHYMANQLAS